MTQALTLAGLGARLRAGPAFAVVMAVAGAPPALAVPTAADFKAVMARALAGDTVALAPGAYPLLALTGYVRTGPVTITALDPADPPTVAGFKLSNCQNIVIQGLNIRPAAAATGVEVLGGSDIHVVGNSILGPPDADGSHRWSGRGARFAGVVRWSLTGNEIAGFYKGGDHFKLLKDSSFGRIESNIFHDICNDAITGCSDNISIRGNLIYDLYRVDANHPDAIQFGTPEGYRIAAQPVNVTISDNVYYKGKGDPAQGVFIKSERAAFWYTGLVVTGNAMIGTMYHGICVEQGDGALISGNLVQGMEGVVNSKGLPMRGKLHVENSRDTTVSGNILTQPVSMTANVTPPILTDNLTTHRVAPADDYSDLLAWVEAAFPLPVPADPKDGVIAGLKDQVAGLTEDLRAATVRVGELANEVSAAGEALAESRRQLSESGAAVLTARGEARSLKLALRAISDGAAAVAQAAADAAGA